MMSVLVLHPLLSEGPLSLWREPQSQGGLHLPRHPVSGPCQTHSPSPAQSLKQAARPAWDRLASLSGSEQSLTHGEMTDSHTGSLMPERDLPPD